MPQLQSIIQGLTITIKLLYVIKFWHSSNFGIHDIPGQIPKSTYQAPYLYLVIFLTIFPKHFLIWIEWNIANSARTDIEGSFQKNAHLNPKNILLSEKSVKFCFLVTFNIIWVTFSWKFHWNSSRFLEDMNFYFFNFNYLVNFWDFLPLLTTKNPDDVSIYKILWGIVFSYINTGLVLWIWM